MQAALFLNGSQPLAKVVRKILQNQNFIVAADGGANYLFKRRIVPNVILGDMDSLNEEASDYFRKAGVRSIRIREQETTDFEKSLNYCLSSGVKRVSIMGATSRRPDHTMNNFSVMKRFCNKMKLSIFTDEFEIFFAGKRSEFSYRKNETLSMIGMPRANGIRTEGLKFRLYDEDLEFGKREGSLNQSVSDKISISYRSGTLLIFRKHFLN